MAAGPSRPAIERLGVSVYEVAAVDAALWDLKAKLLGLSLVDLLGPVREAVPVYGSGGFTSYDERRLAEQLGSWAEEGIGKVKMKVGRRPEEDERRVGLARRAIGPGCALVELRDVEYFHDRVRLEAMLFDGALRAEGGRLAPDRSRPGLGIELKRGDAEDYLVFRDAGE